jgi:kynurenine 3-monooxygenase
VAVRFNTRFIDLDKVTGELALQEAEASESFSIHPDLVIGADGVHSGVRHQINKREMVDLLREHFPWTYKEVVISSTQARLLNLRTDVLHVWPRAESLLVAFANPDGTFGCNLFLDRNGKYAHTSFADERQLESFLADQFGDLAPIAADLAKQLQPQRDSGIVRVRTSQWHFADRAVVVGDAAHAIYQFYGHGTSADIEDCWVLSRCMAESPNDLERAFEDFETLRMADTWELSELSRRHFHALKDQTASPLFRARLATDMLLARLFPGKWHLEYALVAHSHVPYLEVSRIMRRQQKLWRLTGLWLVSSFILLLLLAESFAFNMGQRFRRRPRTHPLRVKPA